MATTSCSSSAPAAASSSAPATVTVAPATTTLTTTSSTASATVVARAHYYLGLARFHLGEYDLAYSALLQARAADPTTASVSESLGAVAAARQRWTAAAMHYADAARLLGTTSAVGMAASSDDASRDALVSCGMMWYRAGRARRGAAILADVAVRWPYDPSVRYELARSNELLLPSGRYDVDVQSNFSLALDLAWASLTAPSSATGSVASNASLGDESARHTPLSSPKPATAAGTPHSLSSPWRLVRSEAWSSIVGSSSGIVSVASSPMQNDSKVVVNLCEQRSSSLCSLKCTLRTHVQQRARTHARMHLHANFHHEHHFEDAAALAQIPKYPQLAPTHSPVHADHHSCRVSRG
jgi:hypothetical protein